MTLTPRLEVMGQILDCECCELHRVGTGPVPFIGPTPNYVAVVGEAPGANEDKAGKPFIGPSGKLLRNALSEAGFNIDQLFVCNAVSCFPNRTPTMGEVNACSGNLRAQLELAGPTWVLLLGGTALSTLRADCKISRARGHVFVPDDERNYFVTYHPSYALRQAKAEAVMKTDLVAFWKMITAPLEQGKLPGWLAYTCDDCLGCGLSPDDAGEHDEVIRFDDMGGSWCEPCWRRQSKEGKGEVRAEAKLERYQVKHGVLFP
jgi:DNA polymerase